MVRPACLLNVWTGLSALLITLAVSCPCVGQIKNWQTGQVIAGTENIVPGPSVYLGGFSTNSRNLNYADLSGLDLRGAILATVYTDKGSWFDSARFTSSDLVLQGI